MLELLTESDKQYLSAHFPTRGSQANPSLNPKCGGKADECKDLGLAFRTETIVSIRLILTAEGEIGRKAGETVLTDVALYNWWLFEFAYISLRWSSFAQWTPDVQWDSFILQWDWSSQMQAHSLDPQFKTWVVLLTSFAAATLQYSNIYTTTLKMYSPQILEFVTIFQCQTKVYGLLCLYFYALRIRFKRHKRDLNSMSGLDLITCCWTPNLR